MAASGSDLKNIATAIIASGRTLPTILYDANGGENIPNIRMRDISGKQADNILAILTPDQLKAFKDVVIQRNKSEGKGAKHRFTEILYTAEVGDESRSTDPRDRIIMSKLSIEQAIKILEQLDKDQLDQVKRMISWSFAQKVEPRYFHSYDDYDDYVDYYDDDYDDYYPPEYNYYYHPRYHSLYY